jgi:hypothetical protein
MLPLPPHITVKKTVDLNKMCVLKIQLYITVESLVKKCRSHGLKKT